MQLPLGRTHVFVTIIMCQCHSLRRSCFVSSLAARDLSAGTIKTYIAGVKFEQISRGFPSPPLALSWARLRLVQAGIARSQAARSHRARLPITPDILRQLRHVWFRVPNPEVSVLWAVAVLAFFGFFRLGELLVCWGSTI